MENRLSLYRERGVSQCMEATFDFVRENLFSWLRIAVVLLALPCVVIAVNQTNIYEETYIQYSTPLSYFFSMFSYHASSFVALALGLCVTTLLTYTLLTAYLEGRLPGKHLTLAEIWGYARRLALKSVLMGLLCFVLFWSMTQHFLILLLVLVVGVPLLLLAPVWIIEDHGLVQAVGKSFRLGFSSWFPLALMTFLITLMAGVMTMVVDVPWMLANLFIGDLVEDGGSEGTMLLARTLVFVFTLLSVFAWYLMMSIVMLSCAFHYGSVSEKEDETTIESEIENFEKL